MTFLPGVNNYVEYNISQLLVIGYEILYFFFIIKLQNYEIDQIFAGN